MAIDPDDPLSAFEDGLDDDLPLLTPEEIEAAKVEALALYRATAKKKAMKAIIAEETRRLEIEAGRRSGQPQMDELVSVFIDLPEYVCDGAITLNINDKFMHGCTYTVPRHVAHGLHEQMYRAWEHQREVDGKSLTQRLGMRRVQGLYESKLGGRMVTA
jgi:hypothetical protein